MDKHITLMNRQIQDLCHLTKLQIILDETIIPTWTKVLHKHETTSLKTARTYIHKALTNLQSRLNNDSLKKYVYTLSNTAMIHAPKKELERAIKRIDTDSRMLDIAIMHCNPCRQKDSIKCMVREVLDDSGYPALWDEGYINQLELSEADRECKGHCKHCVNLGGVE